MSTRSKITIGFILLLLLVYAMSSQLLPSDKARIVKAIEKARVGCEEEDIAAVMSVIAKDYSDDLGLNKAAWFALLTRNFKVYENIRIRILDLRVAVEEDATTAEVTVSARAAAVVASTMGNPDVLARQRLGGTDNARLFFRKDGSDWKLVRAEQINPEQW